MGRQDVLQLPGHHHHHENDAYEYDDDDEKDYDDDNDDKTVAGRGATLFDNGVPAWGRPYDSSHEEGYCNFESLKMVMMTTMMIRIMVMMMMMMMMLMQIQMHLMMQC